MQVHIGAHKTATTHLQDTLELCQDELKNLNIQFFPREQFRNELVFLSQDKIFADTKTSEFLKRYTISSKLFSSCDRTTTLVLSEENILGNILESLDIKPYPSPRLNFVNYSKNLTQVELFMSIRSFADFYPGAYITALRFNPLEALRKKDSLLEKLESGLMPSWVEVVKRVQAIVPDHQIKCWTFSDYLADKHRVIDMFLDKQLSHLPDLPKTIKTATPSARAIEEIELLIQQDGFKSDFNWRNECDAIFRKYEVTAENPKYTFLSETLCKKLNAQFDKDVSELKSNNYLS